MSKLYVLSQQSAQCSLATVTRRFRLKFAPSAIYATATLPKPFGFLKLFILELAAGMAQMDGQKVA